MSAGNRKKVYKMWRKSPRCRKCGVITEMSVLGENQKPNTATFQHAYPKGHANRCRGINQKENTLWCFNCNVTDGFEWSLSVQIKKINNCIDLAQLEQMLCEEIECYNLFSNGEKQSSDMRLYRMLAKINEIVNRMDFLKEV